MKYFKIFVLLFLVFLSTTLVGCKKNVKITFDTGGGTPVAAIEVKKGTDVLKPEVVPTKENALFAYWELDGNEVNFPIKKVDKPLTIKAAWKYKVIFDVEGGTPVESIYVLQNTGIDPTIKTTNSDPEKHFVRWNYGITPVDENFKVTKSITLRAIWGHKLTFFNDVPEEVAHLFVGHNEKPTTLPTIVKDGFVFMGWRDYEDNKFLTLETLIAVNASYYPQWGKKFTFDTNGGNPIEPMVFELYSAVDELPIPTHPDGKPFMHWEVNGVKVDYPINVSENLLLKAVWGYEVSYETGFEDINVETEIYPENYSFPRPANLNKANYIFSTWLLDGEEPTYPITITKNIKLVAQWKSHINYDVDGGSIIPNSFHIVGQPITELPTPTKAGATFAYWYNVTDNMKVELPFTFTKKIQLKAIWEVTLSFDVQGGSELPEIKVKSNEKINDILKNKKTTKPKKTLYNWEINGVELSNAPIYINVSTVAKVIWGYKLTFDTNGGNIIEPKVFRETYSVNKSDLPIPVKEDKTFLYWLKDGVVGILFPHNFQFNTTLIAVWGVALNLYNKKGQLNTTIPCRPNSTITVGNLNDYANLIEEAPGYEVCGWSFSPTSQEKITENFIITEDTNLYPIYDVLVQLKYNNDYIEGAKTYRILENTKINDLYSAVQYSGILHKKAGKYGTINYELFTATSNHNDLYNENMLVNHDNLRDGAIYIHFNRNIYIEYTIKNEENIFTINSHYEAAEMSTDFYDHFLTQVNKVAKNGEYYFKLSELDTYKNKTMKQITNNKDYFRIEFTKIYLYIINFKDDTNYGQFAKTGQYGKNMLVNLSKTKYENLGTAKYANSSAGMQNLINKLNAIAGQKGLLLNTSYITGGTNGGNNITTNSRFKNDVLYQDVHFTAKKFGSVDIKSHVNGVTIFSEINIFGYNTYQSIAELGIFNKNMIHRFYYVKNGQMFMAPNNNVPIANPTVPSIISIDAYVTLRVQYYESDGSDCNKKEFIYNKNNEGIKFGTKYKGLDYTYMENNIPPNITDFGIQYGFYGWAFGEISSPGTGGGSNPETSEDFVFNNEIVSAAYHE